MIKRFVRVVFLFFIFIFLGTLYYLIIKLTNFRFICWFYYVTDYYCPGCGITRCIISMLEGNLYQAFRYNSLVFVTAPVLLAYAINHAYKFITQRRYTFFDKIPDKIGLILAIAAILYGILRNIPSFSFLAPTTIN